MSKPTNTALNVNHNISDSDFNPQYGEVTSQGQVARKPSVANASAARPVQPHPAIGTATQRTADNMPHSNTIYIHSNGPDYHSDANHYHVAPEGTVWLLHTDKQFQMCTYDEKGNSVNVFVGAPPCISTPSPGTAYKLLKELKNVDGTQLSKIRLVFKEGSDPCAIEIHIPPNGKGDNPTITVGG